MRRRSGSPVGEVNLRRLERVGFDAWFLLYADANRPLAQDLVERRPRQMVSAVKALPAHRELVALEVLARNGETREFCLDGLLDFRCPVDSTLARTTQSPAPP